MTPHTIIFDFDSTMVSVETLDLLADRALWNLPHKEQIQREIISITDKAMSGEIPFGEALALRLNVLPLTKRIIDETAQMILATITPSFLQETQFLKQHADQIYVISGGFIECIAPTVVALGLNPSHVYANTFDYEPTTGKATLNTKNLLSQTQGKVKQLKALKLPRPIHVIGDGYTDYEIVKEGEADEFYCFTEIVKRSAVLTHARHSVGSLSEYIDGIQERTP